MAGIRVNVLSEPFTYLWGGGGGGGKRWQTMHTLMLIFIREGEERRP